MARPLGASSAPESLREAGLTMGTGGNFLCAPKGARGMHEVGARGWCHPSTRSDGDLRPCLGSFVSPLGLFWGREGQDQALVPEANQRAARDRSGGELEEITGFVFQGVLPKSQQPGHLPAAPLPVSLSPPRCDTSRSRSSGALGFAAEKSPPLLES